MYGVYDLTQINMGIIVNNYVHIYIYVYIYKQQYLVVYQ